MLCGNLTLGGIPKQCRIKTTWALAYRRNLGLLLQTLALYSYMTIFEYKNRKNWRKKDYYFFIVMTAKEFLVQK